MAPVAGPSVGRPISGHGKKSRRTRLSGNIGAEGSDYEDDATELEYLDHLKDTKKTSTAPTRSRITSNFDPSYHGGTGTDSETSDASQQPPPKKVPSKQRPSSKLSLGAPTASTSKSADSSPKRSTGVQSMLAGLKIHKGPQQPSQSVATAEQSASDGGTPVPPAERKIISARAQRRLNAGKDPIKREWWQTECGVSTTFVAALKKGQFTPTRPGNLKIWGATKPIMHKNYRILSFFKYAQLCPDMHNVFAVTDRAEIRVFQVHPSLGLILRHGLLDSTHNKEPVKPPKRHERESFLALAWSYCFWPSKLRGIKEHQGPEFRGIPLLLAAGNCGVVKVYNGNTMEIVNTLVGHGGPITSISVSPKHPWLVATASLDRSLRVWNLMREDEPSVALLAGVGGHVKEVLACAWHPSRRLVVSSAAERRLKVWAVPDEVYDEPLPRDPETGYVQEQEPPDKKTRPPIQVHNPIASTNIVHADHPDQLEWLDEVRLLTKARTGRTIMGRSKAGVCAEVVIWRFDLLLELAKRHSIDNGLGLGLSGAQQSEGALKLLKRFVIPRQGFWGHTMAFDPSRMTIALPFIGGVWEAKVDLVPFKWGFSTYSRPFDRPDLERSASTDDWEAISPTANSYSNKTLFGVSYSPDGQYAVASGEDGTLLVWKRERDNMIEDVKEENKNAMDEN